MSRNSTDSHTGLLTGDHYRRSPSIMKGVRAFIFSSWLNIGLIFVPLGMLAESLHWSSSVVFTLNFLAIIPLAKMLGYATEDVALRVGETLGGLLNATFGNAVELIIAIIALQKGLISVVQASMLGSILSNLLLVLGLSFFAGGLFYKEQSFNETAAQTSASMMALALSSLMLPAAYKYAIPNQKRGEMEEQILGISHATAILLLIIYIGYLYFQLKTHSHLYVSEGDEEEAAEPEMSLGVGLAALMVTTIFVALCGENLVGAIEGIVEQWHISATFVGLILLPIVGNAAEHLTAVTVAMKDKMDLTIGIALGSSLQIALFATPLMVVIGWIIGQPMTLCFDIYSTCVLFISVLVVNYLINDGKSNWLEGAQLMVAYSIVAVTYYYYPDTN
ncbi:uncharacterized protein VTP21DRAFT_11521 [Calcarisporiella thermophila]|uniref:uncharacterized protein n=1 Tax=Calcarisporiella thermophila TaxID=911321 RepID=UPI003743FB5B